MMRCHQLMEKLKRTADSRGTRLLFSISRLQGYKNSSTRTMICCCLCTRSVRSHHFLPVLEPEPPFLCCLCLLKHQSIHITSLFLFRFLSFSLLSSHFFLTVQLLLFVPFPLFFCYREEWRVGIAVETPIKE